MSTFVENDSHIMHKGLRVLGGVALLLLRANASFAQDKCRIVQDRPTGTTQQGGYAFDYYSAMGSNCRIYKLRNHPGKLKTPVRWKAAGEILVDAILAECPSSSKSCDWLEIVKPSWKPYGDKTQLGYGVNKDEYVENPESFADAQRQGATTAGLEPIITSVSGPIQDAEGKPLFIAIRVASIASRESAGYFKLKYAISSLPGGASFKVDSVKRLTKSYASAISAVWESAEDETFLRQLGKKEDNTVVPEGTLYIETEAKEVEVSWKTLSLMQGGQPIFTTTAPAYRSKGEP